MPRRCSPGRRAGCAPCRRRSPRGLGSRKVPCADVELEDLVVSASSRWASTRIGPHVVTDPVQLAALDDPASARGLFQAGMRRAPLVCGASPSSVCSAVPHFRQGCPRGLPAPVSPACRCPTFSGQRDLGHSLHPSRAAKAAAWTLRWRVGSGVPDGASAGVGRSTGLGQTAGRVRDVRPCRSADMRCCGREAVVSRPNRCCSPDVQPDQGDVVLYRHLAQGAHSCHLTWTLMMSGVRESRRDLQLGLLEVCRVDVLCRGIALLEGLDEDELVRVVDGPAPVEPEVPLARVAAVKSATWSRKVSRNSGFTPLDDDQDHGKSPGLGAMWLPLILVRSRLNQDRRRHGRDRGPARCRREPEAARWVDRAKPPIDAVDGAAQAGDRVDVGGGVVLATVATGGSSGPHHASGSGRPGR